MPFSPKHQKPAASPVTNLFFDAYGDVSPEKTAKSFGKSPGLAGSSIGRDWTFEEVCEWLEANDVYNDFIIENELDGADMLELTVGDLGGVLGFARPVALWDVMHGRTPSSPIQLSLSPKKKNPIPVLISAEKRAASKSPAGSRSTSPIKYPSASTSPPLRTTAPASSPYVSPPKAATVSKAYISPYTSSTRTSKSKTLSAAATPFVSRSPSPSPTPSPTSTAPPSRAMSPQPVLSSRRPVTHAAGPASLRSSSSSSRSPLKRPAAAAKVAATALQPTATASPYSPYRSRTAPSPTPSLPETPVSATTSPRKHCTNAADAATKFDMLSLVRGVPASNTSSSSNSPAVEMLPSSSSPIFTAASNARAAAASAMLDAEAPVPPRKPNPFRASSGSSASAKRDSNPAKIDCKALPGSPKPRPTPTSMSPSRPRPVVAAKPSSPTKSPTKLAPAAAWAPPPPVSAPPPLSPDLSPRRRAAASDAATAAAKELIISKTAFLAAGWDGTLDSDSEDEEDEEDEEEEEDGYMDSGYATRDAMYLARAKVDSEAVLPWSAIHGNPPFKFKSGVAGVKDALLRQGWVQWDERLDDPEDYNLWWKAAVFRESEMAACQPWQRLNHFPKTGTICRKDTLARILRTMHITHGKCFNYMPQSFIVPTDYLKFVRWHNEAKAEEPDEEQTWIYKPASGARGNGLFLFRDLDDLSFESIPSTAVVQRYIDNPYLIDGYKFDLRIYVVVTSYHPLTCYMYREGLARFSTEKYDISDIANVFMHLTNTSINKHSDTYMDAKESVGAGCKWTLQQLRAHFKKMGVDDSRLWQRVTNIILLTLVSLIPEVPKTKNCFELLGFDVLIDEKLKPWLIEVNFSPALSSDGEAADIITKPHLIKDMMRLVNFSPEDAWRYDKTAMARGARRGGGPSAASRTGGNGGKARKRGTVPVKSLRKTKPPKKKDGEATGGGGGGGGGAAAADGSDPTSPGKKPIRHSNTSKLRMEARSLKDAQAQKRAAALASRFETGSKNKFVLEPRSLRKVLPQKGTDAEFDVEKDFPRNVGGLCRVFPFSDESYRAAAMTGKRFSLKEIIGEIKRHLSAYKGAAEKAGGHDVLEMHSRWNRPEDAHHEPGAEEDAPPCYYYPCATTAEHAPFLPPRPSQTPDEF